MRVRLDDPTEPVHHARSVGAASLFKSSSNRYAYVFNSALEYTDPHRFGGHAARPESAEFAPAPANLIGTRHYYKFRNDQAPDSFRNGTGANYYADFGLKKFDAYQALKLRTNSEALRGFIDNAAAELQTQLETRLRRDRSIEATRPSLMEIAFETHSGAYRAAGFGQLSVVDQALVLATAGIDVFAAGIFSGLGMFAKSIDMAFQPSDNTLHMMGTDLLLVPSDR